MVKSVVKSFLLKHTVAERRENARKTEILRAFGGRLMRRSHAPKPRALPTALHTGGDGPLHFKGDGEGGHEDEGSGDKKREGRGSGREKRGGKSTARLQRVGPGARIRDRLSGNLYALGFCQNRAVLFSFLG